MWRLESKVSLEVRRLGVVNGWRLKSGSSGYAGLATPTVRSCYSTHNNLEMTRMLWVSEPWLRRTDEVHTRSFLLHFYKTTHHKRRRAYEVDEYQVWKDRNTSFLLVCSVDGSERQPPLLRVINTNCQKNFTKFWFINSNNLSTAQLWWELQWGQWFLGSKAFLDCMIRKGTE